MRVHHFLLAGLVGAAIFACGSETAPSVGGSGGPVSDGGPGAEPDAGPATQPDAGPATQPDAGPSAQPDAGPGAQPDAGPGAQPDAGGGGSGGGPSSAECDGIVPENLGSSFSFQVPKENFPDWICNSDTTDESGNIASALDSAQFKYADRLWHLFDASGQHLARITAFQLFPQGPGFEGLYSFDTQFGPPSIRIAYWTPQGNRTDGPVVGGDEAGARGYRAWPNGLLVVRQSCQAPPGRYALSRFDDRANELAATALDGGCNLVLGAVGDANGNWLLVVHGLTSQGFPEEAIFARWFDSAGNLLTGWFRVGPVAGSADTAIVHALIGGGAALQVDGVWTYFLPSGKAEVHAAPAFLLGHPGADFTLVRGARAYAVLPRSGDTTQLELYSHTGNRCGSIKFPTGGLTTGADGSVISASGPDGCTKTVWPGLLR
jgi:hypothetical protein